MGYIYIYGIYIIYLLGWDIYIYIWDIYIYMGYIYILYWDIYIGYSIILGVTGLYIIY